MTAPDECSSTRTDQERDEAWKRIRHAASKFNFEMKPIRLARTLALGQEIIATKNPAKDYTFDHFSSSEVSAQAIIGIKALLKLRNRECRKANAV